MTSAVVLFGGVAALPAAAKPAVPPPMPSYQPMSDQQLDQLLGPIALYPDPLLAQILPAATLPTQIVMADRYLASGGDPNQADQQPWDPSVQALVRYPSVLQYLDNNLEWTTQVGEAFLNQQDQVMASVQRLRASAQNYGNLVSSPQQQVVEDNGDIEILPVNPEVIYVPTYPDYVYYQGGCSIGFGFGFTIGPWLDCDFDWHRHHLFFWDRDHARPGDWWRERPAQRATWMAHEGTVWRAQDHHDFVHEDHGDRGWGFDRNRTAAPAYSHGAQVHNNNVNNNIVVNMSKPAVSPHPFATPRLMATPQPAVNPRPAATHDFGSANFGSHPVTTVHPANNNNAFVGSENSRDVRSFSTRGQESMHTVTPAAPIHSEPVHTESVHTEAPVSHPAPSFQGGCGGGGGGGGGGEHHR